MAPDRAPALQDALAQGNGQHQLLGRGLAGGDDVLQIHGGGASGIPDQGQETVKVPFPEGQSLGLGPAVFRVDVESPVYRPVSRGLADFRQGGQERLLRHLPQDLLAKAAADGLQFIGDGCVFGGQVRVARAGVQDAQGIAVGVEVQADLLHHRTNGIGEVDGHHAAHGGGGLIHQAAGLAEKHVLGVLADLGDLHRGAFAIPEQVVQHGADQHLKGGGGAEAAAAGDGGGHVHIQSHVA